ncbi:MAG TPA: hypothetical protein VK859_14550, partial [bacterium]|nr:hypothetical protein [bacterium]
TVVFTLTPTPGPEKIVIYPNPGTGTEPVQIVFQSDGSGDVKLFLFTTAFRKVLEENLGPLPAGTQATTLELRDQRGTILANGLYYVVISQGSKRLVGKLLVIR